ncbi:hypothetical protein E8E12_001325 [Didymella heteroderae]|uniref:F-box domain-containing protein n=1 Tax=Didymella heteroderae TaxID=1769908 RepID=A0A9P4WFY8_9PLEO|nr:hypothetical protein E8E12_001325 [Didymella heteroderae]
MLLFGLPNELLCQICEDLRTAQDIASFNRVNRQLYRVTEEYLYRFDAREGRSSALLWAAVHGRLQTAKKALKELQRDEQLTDGSGTDANTTNATATNPIDSALVHAAEKGRTALVRLLVENGADWSWRDPERRQSAMEAACSNGHIEVVKVLLNMGAEASEGYYMRPYPIQCAAMMGYTEIVRLLIDTGASADTCSDRPEGGSFPPLQLAVRGDHEGTAKLLIAKGAKINLRIGRMHTALEEAVMGNRLWAVRLLLASGAMVFAPHSGLVRRPALKWAEKPGREEIFELIKDQTVHVWPEGFSEEDTAAKRAMP